MSDRRHTHTTRALCLECEWTDDARGSQGRAAQHHDRTGHTTRAETTITYYAEPVTQDTELDLYPGDPHPGVLTLL